jgi:hypothetical protein
MPLPFVSHLAEIATPVGSASLSLRDVAGDGDGRTYRGVTGTMSASGRAGSSCSWTTRARSRLDVDAQHGHQRHPARQPSSLMLDQRGSRHWERR